MNKVFNYIRCSGKDQNEARQVEAMEQWNKENKVYNAIQLIDKATGTNTDRPDLQMLLKVVGEGDIVVISSIDRLSRNYNECMELWKQITIENIYDEEGKIIGTKPKADIVVLDMPILDTRKHKDLLGTLISDIILQVLAYVAQQETEFRKARQEGGIKAMPIDEKTGKRYSSKTGRPTGRPVAEYPSNWNEVYNQWKNGEIKAVEAMAMLELKKTTFYKLVKQYEQQ